MRNLFTRLFFGVLAAFFLTSAHAEVIPANKVNGDRANGTCDWAANGKIGSIPNSSLGECQSHAESLGDAAYPGKPKPYGWKVVGDTANKISTTLQYCTIISVTNPAPNCNSWAANVNANLTAACASGSFWDQGSSSCKKYDCPAGYDGPKTIGGQPNMCEKLNCVPGESKVVGRFSGWLICPPPAAGSSISSACHIGWTSPPSSVCDGSCRYSLGDYITSDFPSSGGSPDNPVVIVARYNGTGTGASCSVSDADPSGPPPDPNKPPPPPCGPGEGVLETPSGPKCVPEGTPGSDSGGDTDGGQPGDGGTGDGSDGGTGDGTGNGTGDGPGSGTGTGNGTGNGIGNGAGNGDGDGECEGDDCGQCDPKLKMCGHPSIDDLYQKKDKTVSDVLNKFSDDMHATPIGKAFTEVFDVNIPAGQCPNLAVDISYLNTTIDLAPYICNPTAIQYLEVMGTILKIVVGFLALTWVLF